MESNALDLPEIRTLLGPHLCVLVCKAWHNTFIRFLWATFYFGHPREINTTDSSDAPQPPERATIEKYAHLIQDLLVIHLTPTFRLDLFRGTPLPSLKKLHLSPNINSDTMNISHLGWIFRQNSGLRVVKYDGLQGGKRWSSYSTLDQKEEQEEEEVLALLDSCREIVDLTVRYVQFKGEYWEGFRGLCATRLRRLVFYYCKGLEGVEWEGILMPHLLELNITSGRVKGQIAARPELRMVAQCPNLRTLRWYDDRGRDPDSSSFYQILVSCPRLEAVELQRMVLSDDEIATVLKSMVHPAREIILPTSNTTLDLPRIVGFGWKAFGALARRHLTERLVVLDIGPMNGFVTSGQVLRVLYSCAGLREIGACRVLGREICERAQVEGMWACRGLEVFKMRVAFELSDEQFIQTQEGVFRQLSRLTRLRVLNVGTRTTTTIQQQMYSLFSKNTEESLQFKLEYGLAQLTGLERLEILSVCSGGGGVPQRLEREDVNWMRRWWRGLKVVEGELCPKKEVNAAIGKVLTIRARWPEGHKEEAKEEERFLGMLDEVGYRRTDAAAAVDAT